MRIALAAMLALHAPENAPLPDDHKLAQAVADMRTQSELRAGKTYLQIYKRPMVAIVRNVECVPIAIPPERLRVQDGGYTTVMAGPLTARAAAQCRFEYIWIRGAKPKNADYTGPRQKFPPALTATQQRKIAKGPWHGELRIVLLAEFGPCWGMSRSPPRELDCGDYWYFSGST